MKAKVFEMPGKAKVMVIDNEEFVEYYLQINSSNWHLCCGCKEDFDKVTKEDAKMIWDEYYEYVDEDEEVTGIVHKTIFQRCKSSTCLQNIVKKVLEKHAKETIASSEANEETKPVEFRKELVDLMVQSLTTNLELCASVNKNTKQYCEMLMNNLEKAHQENNIKELDKLFGMCRKQLLTYGII